MGSDESNKSFFSEDPVPNLHHYIENFPGGQTISPTFGGNTANVEFEALTSYSMSLLKPGSIPYQQVITNKKEIPSIPTALKRRVLHKCNSFIWSLIFQTR